MSRIPEGLECGGGRGREEGDKESGDASRPLGAESEIATTASERRLWITRLPTRLWLMLL